MSRTKAALLAIVVLITLVIAGTWFLVPIVLKDRGPDEPDPRSVALRTASSCETLRMDFEPSLSADPSLEVLEGTWRKAPRQDGSGWVLQQGATDRMFPLILLSEAVYGDFEASVEVRAVSGRIDGAGGFVFRLTTAKDYYVLRTNAVEQNVELYAVVDGRRYLLQEVPFKLEWGRWYYLSLTVVGDHIEGSVDGNKLIDVRHHRFAAGRIGLWTKADSVSEFDNVRMQSIDRECR